MQTLTKKEWIAIVVVIVVVILFLGSMFLQPRAIDNITKNTNMNQNQKAVDGLIINDTLIGTGMVAKAGDMVSVQYTGKFADGKVFDSSIPRGQPIEFILGAGRVIKGWDLGIDGMKVGGKRSLTISANLAYGASGYPPVIPPNATLYFDVELTGVRAQ